MNILNSIDLNIAKKIFSSKDNVEKYLTELNNLKNINLRFREITRGRNQGTKVLDMVNEDLWNKIISSWNYSDSLKVIRDLFKKSKKYNNGKIAKLKYKELVAEWNNLNLGLIKWPCSQGAFDEFVQRVNNSNATNKDEIVKKASVQYRRMKELNTVRNDFLEIEIFEKNSNILPTLNHSRGTDYFINGESFDQKVAKSPTKEFMRAYGDNWKKEAIKQPEKVAEYLYKYQDEGRFGADSRILIVYLDEDVDLEKIEETINKINLNQPLRVSFTYNHARVGEKSYQVKCFVIVLSN
ncbi:hypothetical protein COU53_04140 [Candidatus Pacearchaeota archaeon CG10_big_fil_rev_8_21_14_0_10_30_48]|nr:MAG: hypothetical protein COU53_04140 [Candidatus Pacearchaeota archaeon CG10_big_fil_rev_8_21_14_0_10_30_48]